MASLVQAELHSIAAATDASSPVRPEDAAVLMRGDRGRGRRMRVVSKTKLPRMNNSERGKFYRQKYREYEEQLERDVQRLQGEVLELQRLLELRQLLPIQYPSMGLDEVQAATQVVYEGLIQLHEHWTSINGGAEPLAIGQSPVVSDEIRSAERVHSPRQTLLCPSQSEQFIARHQDTLTPLLFKLESVEIEGCSDSRIVVAHGRLYTQYHPEDLEVLFPVIQHNKHLAARLLAREVAYHCTYRFHTATPFGANDLSFVSVELDAVGGLLTMIPSLVCVEALLTSTIYSDHSGVKAEEATTKTGSSNCYERSPALLAAAIRVVDEREQEENYPTSPTPPRPMTLAFILS